MTFKPDLSLIDINGLGYAAMYIPALSRLEVNGFSTGAIHGAMTSLFSNMARNPDAVPFVLWDCRATWRHESLPEYKGNRSNNPDKIAIRESYRKQVPIIQLLLGALGIPQISCGEAEADDVAGAICRNIHPSWLIELTSKDTDWFQSIAPNVVWHSPFLKRTVDLTLLANPDNGLSDGHFFTPREYLHAKALAGDDSDCIPGIDGVGLATAVKIMRQHDGTIEGFWRDADEGRIKPKGVIKERLASTHSRDIYARNLKLMDWGRSPPMQTNLLSLTAGSPDWLEVQSITEEFGLKKAFTQARESMKPWQSRGWGQALWAVDAALNNQLCQQLVNPNAIDAATQDAIIDRSCEVACSHP